MFQYFTNLVPNVKLILLIMWGLFSELSDFDIYSATAQYFNANCIHVWLYQIQWLCLQSPIQGSNTGKVFHLVPSGRFWKFYLLN